MNTPGALPFQTAIPFVEMLGLELLSFEGGNAEIALTLRSELMNSWGVAHGGVTMTLLDVVMAHAARSPDVAGGEPRSGVVTVEMKTSFLRPAVGQLLASGQLLQRTVSLAFCQGSVFNEHGELLAHATGTFKYVTGLLVGEGDRRQRIQRQGASD